MGIALLVFVLAWFQPHKLFIDERVDEELPVTVGDTPEADDEPASSDGGDEEKTTEDGIVDLARGEFISIDHGTSGVVRLVELADGSRIVRLEDLATDNGPDLYLYLSTNPADGPPGAFEDEYLSLGRLKGNLGNQNYEVPGDVPIEKWRSVVVWCDRFSSAFGAADLESV